MSVAHGQLPGSTEIKIGSDNLNNSFPLAKDFKWTASNSKVMWKDGAEVTAGTDWGVAPLGIFGFVAPTFELADADNAKYVILNKNTGAFSLSEAGKVLSVSKDIVVNIVAESRWGTITGYDAAKTVTVKIDLSKEAASI